MPLFTSLPETNATLTLIAGGGSSADYDQVEGADTPRWTGSRRSYVDEQLLTNVNGEARDEVTHTRLITVLEPGELAQRGDSVTFKYGGQVQTRTIRNVTVHRVSGIVSFSLEDL